MVVLPILSIAAYVAAVVGHHPNIGGPDAFEKFSGFIRIGAVILLLLGFVSGVASASGQTLLMSVVALIVIGMLATYDYMIVAKKARKSAKESVAKAGKEYLETKKEIEKGPDQVTNVQGDAVTQKTQQTHVDQSTTNVDTIDQSRTNVDRSKTHVDQSRTNVDQSRTVNDQRTQVEDSVVNRSDISAADETAAPQNNAPRQQPPQQQPPQQQPSQQRQPQNQQPRQPQNQPPQQQPSQQRPPEEREVEANPRNRDGQPAGGNRQPAGQGQQPTEGQPRGQQPGQGGAGGASDGDRCPNCGEEIAAGWSNCISCGAEL